MVMKTSTAFFVPDEEGRAGVFSVSIQGLATNVR
jgi:hypothetical protein